MINRILKLAHSPFLRPVQIEEERNRILAKLDIENRLPVRIHLMTALHDIDQRMPGGKP